MTSSSVPAAVVREEAEAVLSGGTRVFADVDLVILPNGRDEENRGLYPAETVFLGKDLRAAGYRVVYADPPGSPETSSAIEERGQPKRRPSVGRGRRWLIKILGGTVT